MITRKQSISHRHLQLKTLFGGVCATAILVRALGSLGAEVDWFIPSRIEDGYGLSSATVERLVWK